MVETVNGAIRALNADAIALRKEQSENPTVPDRETDRHDASAKLFNDLATDLKQFRNSPTLVKRAVEALVDSEVIPDLGFHPNMEISFSPTEIDLKDKKTGTVIKVTEEGVTTSPNVWELAQQRLQTRGIDPTRNNVIDECMHILNTRYMRENGNMWGIATEDLQERGISQPTGTQVAVEVNRLAKNNGISNPGQVDFLQPIDITPDSWLHRQGTTSSRK
jgi:hypothetical protein